MKDDDPTDVDSMIHGIYGLDYDDKIDIFGDPVNPVISNLRVFLIADKYDVPAVRATSKEKFRGLVSSVPETEKEWDALIEAVRFFYEIPSSPIQDLKEIILTSFCDHFTKFCSYPGFRGLFDSQCGIAEFALDLFPRVFKNMSPNCFTCGRCEASFGLLKVGTKSPTKKWPCCPMCGRSRRSPMPLYSFWPKDTKDQGKL